MNRGPAGHCAAVPGTLAALQHRRSEENKTASDQARPFERVRESFAKQGLMELLGAEVSKVSEGWCVIEAPYGEKPTQQQRYFHGAGAEALGGSAGGYAALTLASEGREILTVRSLARRGRASRSASNYAYRNFLNSPHHYMERSRMAINDSGLLGRKPL